MLRVVGRAAQVRPLVFHQLANMHTQILSIRPETSAENPRDFGLVFSDATSPNTPLREPCQKLAVSFTTDVAREQLTQAALHLRAGELVAFPTETVYGLGACALRTDAAEKIYSAKNRPADNPLIVHTSDCDMLAQILPDGYELNPVCNALINAFWPGPLTLLFPVGANKDGSPRVPSTVTCGQPTVGVRMPSHPIARALIALAGVPIAAPSANASGRPSPTAAMHVFNDLGARGVLRYIVDGGECTVGVESTVVDATTVPGEVRVLRPGGISVEQISSVLAHVHLDVRLKVYGKDLARSADAEAAPTTPGMKYRHYSPDARVVLVRTDGSSAQTPGFLSVLKAEATALHSAAVELLSESSTAPRAAEMIQRRAKGPIRIGIMCASDSPLMQVLERQSDKLLAWKNSDMRISPVVKVGPNQVCVYSMGTLATPAVAAQRLFDGLRTLDADVPWDDGHGFCDVIVSEVVPETGVGLAIMNRLQKAASDIVTVSC